MFTFVNCFPVLSYFILVGTTRTNFEIKKFELCNNTQRLIKYYGNITKERNGNHYLTMEIISPVEWGSNLGSICLIESLVTKKSAVELFTIKEKDLCHAARMYMGEFWYDIVRSTGQFNIKACPRPAGRFHVQHLLLDFNKISLQTFPFGTLRFTLKGFDHKSLEIVSCLMVTVENRIN